MLYEIGESVSGIILLPFIASAKTVVCNRCGLNYPEQEDNCTHCTGLSDLEVLVLKEESSRQRGVLKKLAVLFLISGAVFALSVLAYVL